MGKLITLITFLATFACAVSEAPSPASVRDSLRALLPGLSADTERLAVYYDLFDLTNGDNRNIYIDSIAAIGQRLERPGIMLDALRHKGNANLHDEALLQALIDSTATFAPGAERDETSLFLRMLLITEQSSHTPLPTDTITAIMARLNANSIQNPYEKALALHKLCLFLDANTSGQLLQIYLDVFGRHLAGMNLPVGAVRTAFLNRSAIAYRNADNYQRVLEADRRLLGVIDSLTVSYAATGRHYRDLATNRFLCYQRMLGCYPILPEDSVDLYMAKIEDLARTSPTVDYNLRENGLARIYFLMAKGQYARAKNLILEKMDRNYMRPYRLKLLRMLIKCARQTGDTALERETAYQIQQYYDSHASDMLQANNLEVEILSGLASLQMRNTNLETAAHEAALQRERERRRGVMMTAIILAVLLIVLLGLGFTLLARTRNLRRSTASLIEANRRLEHEQTRLRHAQQELTEARDHATSADRLKTDFINNMSHEVRTPLAAITEYSRLIVDCVPEEKRQYLERFAHNIEFNSALINNIVNEVLEVAELENRSARANLRPESLHTICHLAIDTIFEKGQPANPEVELIFNPRNQPDVNVTTDRHRTAQIIMNMLANAGKFTESGSITLDYEVEGDRVTVSVTDTGIGIPRGREEEIFLRFRQLNPNTQGVGLGLYIVDKIAGIIGTKVKVDPSYRRGARFVFDLVKS